MSGLALTPVTKTNCDASTDDPKLALLTDLAAAIDKINAIIAAAQADSARLTTLSGISATQATDLASLSTFIGTLLNDSDAATARATLKLAQISPVTATVAANALTLGLNATSLDFRSATLTTGVPNARDVPSAISLVVPDTATLGTVNAIPARLAILAIDYGGTVELAVVNISGGNNLDETTLISTTSITTAADSANVIYSTTARTSVPFRVVGFIDITEATAGTWATAPTLVQGAGGLSMVTEYGQTVHVMTPGVDRSFNATYYNTTGKKIGIAVVGGYGSGATMTLVINGVTTCRGYASGSAEALITYEIPVGASYSITATVMVLNTWTERY